MRIHKEVCAVAFAVGVMLIPSAVLASTLKTFGVYKTVGSDKVVIVDSSSTYLVQYGYGCYNSDFSYGQVIYIDTYSTPSVFNDIYLTSAYGDKKCSIIDSDELNLKSYFFDKDLGNDKIIVSDKSGTQYLVEYGIGCLSIWRYEGKVIDMDIGGSFLDGIGDRIYLFDSDDDCKVWDADEIQSGNQYVPYTPPVSTPPVASAIQQNILTPTPAVNNATHPNGTAILGSDGKTVFVLGNGKRRGFATPEEYNSQGFTFADIVQALPTDLALPEGSVVPFADGTLVLDSTDNRTVYIIDAGKKRGFTTPDVFQGLGYSFDKAVKGNLSTYPAGEPIASKDEPHPAGALINLGMVYKVTSNGKLPIPDLNVFNSWNLSFKNVVTGNNADNSLPVLGSLKFRDGTLLKKSNGQFLIVSDGTLRPFASSDVFARLGYSVSRAVNVADTDITAYTVGLPID